MDEQQIKTHPVHGGKMYYEELKEYTEILESLLKEFVSLERVQTPDMSGRRRTSASMMNGVHLARLIDETKERLCLNHV